MKIYNNHTRYTKYTKYKQKTFVVAFSGGNDSSRALQLFYEMLANLPKNEQRQSYAIVSNTLVEAPNINDFLLKIIKAINSHAKKHKIPFKVIQVSPKLQDEFWFNLIGKGYPSPTRTLRF